MDRKFSIIVPTYNSEKWIKDCINSILNQTYQYFDIIVIDSGSTDDTLLWIKSIKNNKVRIYETDKRLNIAENWNRILSIPRNEFMTILGHDDILNSNYLEVINTLISNNDNASLYQTNFNFIDEHGKVIRNCAPFASKIFASDFIEAILKNTIEITATGFMVRTIDYDEVGGIPLYPNLLYSDIELWLKLIAKNHLAVAQEITFSFRFHNNNTSKFIGKTRLIAFEMLVDFFCLLKTKQANFKLIIDKYGYAFIQNYAIGTCNKLIYTPIQKRDGVTVDTIINSANKCLINLLPNSNVKLKKNKNILLAKTIDSIYPLRKLFLFYKKFSKRTF